MLNFEITKREIIISVIIILFMLSLGFFISTKVHDNVSVNNEKYFKALKVNDDPKLFEYAIDTNVGNIVSYGEFVANEPVSDSLIEGEYLSIIKLKQRYVQKTRTVTYTDSNGNTRIRTETYWEWDTVKREQFNTKTLNYLNKKFSFDKFGIGHHSYNETVKTGMTTRYKFYTIPISFDATLFSVTENKDIEKNEVYPYKTIDKLMEEKENEANVSVIIFWIAWIILIIIAVIGFIALENKYINNYK